MKKIISNNLRSLFLIASIFCCASQASAAPEIKKAFLYDQHTLKDSYPYKNTTREFQWNKISDYLTLVDSIQTAPAQWGILQNYRNDNGRAPLVKNPRIDEYKRNADSFNVEQNQAIPLYSSNDLSQPERYGQDGDLVKILQQEGDFVIVEHIYFRSQWLVPKQYLYPIHNGVEFNHVIFIDRTNQNIATLEKSGSTWLVRSMNPATTGAHNPPYQMSTPLGIFVIQQHRDKMMYYRDGTTIIGGYAPYASRFSTGAYMHGVPVNLPRTENIEFSPTLGTTPRSHKCVRNATSHAKFIYDWAPVDESLVIVFD